MKRSISLFFILSLAVILLAENSKAEDQVVLNETQVKQIVDAVNNNNNDNTNNAQGKQSPVIVVVNSNQSQQQSKQGQVNYIVDEMTKRQEEEEKKSVVKRSIFTLGYTQQRYNDEYKNDTIFYGNNKNSIQLLSRNVDRTDSINIGYIYDIEKSINAMINPFIGIEANINIPISSQNNFDFNRVETSNEEIPFGYTLHGNGYLDYSLLSNFVDLKVRVGNNFRLGKNLNIIAYLSGGITSSIYYHMAGMYKVEKYSNNRIKKTYNMSDGSIEKKVGFSVGYTYGFGVDVVLTRHLLVGVFYERKQMLKSTIDSVSSDDGSALAMKEIGDYYNPVSKYANQTFGVRIGYVY